MTPPAIPVLTTGRRSGLAHSHRESLRLACARLADLDDVEFGVRLLANTPTNFSRDRELLRRWAQAALSFGADLAEGRGAPDTAPDAPGPAAKRGAAPVAAGRRGRFAPSAVLDGGVRVIERGGGLDPGRLLVARYRSRPAPTVELFTDTLDLAEELTELLGWRQWFPPGSARSAALAHEEAHRRLHDDKRLRHCLKQRLGHTAWHLGRHRLLGHVAGADELAAHGYARAAGGLSRSPLLLTAALASATQTIETN